MDTNELKTARQQVAELEKTMLAEIEERAALLGYTLTKTGEPAPTKQKRTRRTKAQIAADNEAANG